MRGCTSQIPGSRLQRCRGFLFDPEPAAPYLPGSPNQPAAVMQIIEYSDRITGPSIPAWPAGKMPPLPAASFYLEAIDNELARADSPEVVNALLDRRNEVMRKARNERGGEPA